MTYVERRSILFTCSTSELYSVNLCTIFFCKSSSCWQLNPVQVKKLKPHVLLGLSGVGGIFDEQVRSLVLSFPSLFFIISCYWCLMQYCLAYDWQGFDCLYGISFTTVFRQMSSTWIKIKYWMNNVLSHLL